MGPFPITAEDLNSRPVKPTTMPAVPTRLTPAMDPIRTR